MEALSVTSAESVVSAKIPTFPRKGCQNFTQYMSEGQKGLLRMRSQRRPKQGKENSKNMNKPKIKQHLRRGFFALAIVGALLTLPKAQAQPIPAVEGTTAVDPAISGRTPGETT